MALSGCLTVRATPAPNYEGQAVAVDPGGSQAVVAVGLDGVGPGTFAAAIDGNIRTDSPLDIQLNAGFSSTILGLFSIMPLLETALTTNTFSAGGGLGLRGRVLLGSEVMSPTLGLGAGFGAGVAESDTISPYVGAWAQIGLAVPVGLDVIFFDLGGSFTEDQWRQRPLRAHFIVGYSLIDGLRGWLGLAVQRGGFSCVDSTCPWEGLPHGSIGPRVGFSRVLGARR